MTQRTERVQEEETARSLCLPLNPLIKKTMQASIRRNAGAACHKRIE